MTTIQKIIKYIALVFAGFLIITIISAILNGGYNLLQALGLIHTNSGTVTEELNVISGELEEISTLKIDLSFTNLYIKAGEKFKVETNNSTINFTDDSGNVKIKEKNKGWLNNKNLESNLIIYIPDNMVDLDQVEIDTGAGKIHIEKLNAKELNFKLGAGDVYIENLTADKEANIDGGVGKTEIRSSQINNLNVDLGMGEFIFDGKVTGKSEVNSGVGAINIDLIDNKENYSINVSKGIGNVTIDGENIEKDQLYGKGENYLDINGGIGEINVKFKAQ